MIKDRCSWEEILEQETAEGINTFFLFGRVEEKAM